MNFVRLSENVKIGFHVSTRRAWAKAKTRDHEALEKLCGRTGTKKPENIPGKVKLGKSRYHVAVV